MQAVASASLAAVGQRIPSVPGAFHRPASNSASTAPTLLGTLIIDVKGDIRFVSDSLAQLSGHVPSALVGRPVRSILPGLPLNAATEGYNVAYGAFAAAQRERQSWILRAYDDSSLVVEGHLAMMKMNTGYLFCLELHRVQRQANVVRSGPGRIWCKQRCVPVQPPAPVEGGQADAPPQDAARCVRIVLDRQFRVGFACSSIEHLLGFDYEDITGTHVSVLMPELLHRLGTKRSVKRFREVLQAEGSIACYARHTDGAHIPVRVKLLDDPCDAILPLLLQLDHQ